jgi:hypothetical protein
MLGTLDDIAGDINAHLLEIGGRRRKIPERLWHIIG